MDSVALLYIVLVSGTSVKHCDPLHGLKMGYSCLLEPARKLTLIKHNAIRNHFFLDIHTIQIQFTRSMPTKEHAVYFENRLLCTLKERGIQPAWGREWYPVHYQEDIMYIINNFDLHEFSPGLDCAKCRLIASGEPCCRARHAGK